MCAYGSLSYKQIFPSLEKFIKSLDYKSNSNFKPALKYGFDLYQDFLVFLRENDLR